MTSTDRAGSQQRTAVSPFLEFVTYISISIKRFCSTMCVSAKIGHIRILGIGLELAWNGGSCGGISLIRD